MDAIDLLFLWEENKQIKKNPNTNQRVFSALFVTIGSLNDLILASSVICENPSPMQAHRELDTEFISCNSGGIIFKINQLATVTNQRRLDSTVKKIKKSI